MAGLIDPLGFPIDTAAPVDRRSPLNQGRAAWLLALPHLAAGPTFYDLAGVGNGTLSGATWGPTSRSGGSAQLNLDGSSGYANLGNPSAWNFGAGDFTILAWVYVNSVAGYQIFVGKDSDTLGRQFDFGVSLTTTGKLGFYDGSVPTVVEGATITAAGWHRAGVRRSGGNYSFAADGVLGGTAGSTSGNISGNAPVNLGRRSYSGFPQYLGGALDDVVAYNRALSSQEIAADYAESVAGYPTTLNRLSGALTVLMAPWGSGGSTGDISAIAVAANIQSFVGIGIY